jgi:L-threonylcarbamoyladenylate synthase
VTVLAFQGDDAVTAAAPTVAHHLRGGGIIAYPTETVYGLGSRPVVEDVATLSRVKSRPEGKPFLLLVSSRQMAESFGLVFTAAAHALAEQFWPGPLTLVLAGGEGRLPDALRGPEGGIAVRWTSHPEMGQLINALQTPITSTSANRPGGPTAPGVAAILETFESEVDSGLLLVLDGGVLGNVPPSTLVDCTTSQTRLVRAGAIPRNELRARVGSFAP